MYGARSKNSFNKTILSGAVSAALSIGIGLGVTTAQADIYKFTFGNGGLPGSCDPTTFVCPAGDGVFTILNSGGTPTANSTTTYLNDSTWGYGQRSQIGGSITIKETDGSNQGKGVATVDPFDFFDSGPAVAHDISLVDVGDGSGTLGTGTLWLGQMLFDWNNNNGIPVSLVWDLQGLLDGLSGLDVNNVASPGNVIAGVGAEPGSSKGLKKGLFPIGPSPIATTVLDTTPLCDPDNSNSDPAVVDCVLGLNPTGSLPLIADAAPVPGTNTDPTVLGIGGSPMVTIPFQNFNANFDVFKLTLSGYNDTTPPIISFSNTSVSIDINAAFDENSPGVTVTCTDTADGAGALTAAGGSTNASLSFAINAADVAAIDSSISGTYPVRYSCTDSGSARTAITDDPENIGNPTVPADNTSADSALTVVVADPNAPVITITNDGQPTQHEACTVYNDDGATATDLQDDDTTLTAAIVVGGDIGSVDGLNLPDGTLDAAITYDVTDTQANPAPGQFSAVTRTRTVTVSDTLPPVLTVAPTFTVESSACVAFNANLPTAVSADTNNCNPGSSPVITTNTVDCAVPDGQDTQDSTLLFSADDNASPANTGTTSTVVTVSRSEPVISLLGSANLTLSVGDSYTELGMDVHDVQDGDLTAVTMSGTTAGVGAGAGNLMHDLVIRDASATIVASVDTSVEGATYTITYDATDSDSNVATQVTRNISVGVFATNSNFTMLQKAGNTFGGTNDVVFQWDESLNMAESDTNFNMQIASAKPTTFEGAVWVAHDVRAFGPGTYYIETDNANCSVAQIQSTGCPGTAGSPTSIEMIVGPGQVGGHILFDWNGVINIDVVNVWDRDAVWDDFGDTAPRNAVFLGNGVPPDVTKPWKLVSTTQFSDGNGTVHGSPMIDGPFQGFYANFNAGPGGVGAGLPPIATKSPNTKLGSSSMSLWSMFAGLLFLIGLRKVNRSSNSVVDR